MAKRLIIGKRSGKTYEAMRAHWEAEALESMRSDETLKAIAVIVESCPVHDVSPRQCAEEIVRYLTNPRLIEPEEKP